MAYQVTKRVSYGSRILNSIVGVLIGIVLIIGMSILLFVNEGRFNLAELAKDAVQIEEADSSLDGQLVWYKGTLTGMDTMSYDSVISDNDHIRVTSSVEVYAWIESSHTETVDNLGGSQDQITTYTYALGWTSSPQNPTSFNDSEKRSLFYAQPLVQPINVVNSTIKAGDFDVNSNTLTIDDERPMPLSAALVEASSVDKINGNYIIHKAEDGTSTPSIGDTRVSYRYIPNSINGVLVGRADGESIVKFTNDDGSIYRFFQAQNLDEVVAILNQEHKTTTWLLRIIGAILICIGFTLLTGPLSTILMVVPFLGKASNFIFTIIAFLIGLVYSLIVIIISVIFHNPIALAIAIVLLVILIIFGYRKRKAKKALKTQKA